jgi:hypothetical protein
MTKTTEINFARYKSPEQYEQEKKMHKPFSIADKFTVLVHRYRSTCTSIVPVHVHLLFAICAICHPKNHTIGFSVFGNTMQTSADENDTTVEHTVHLQVTGMMCQKSCGKEDQGSVESTTCSCSCSCFNHPFLTLQRSMISMNPRRLYSRECSQELTRMHSRGSVLCRQVCVCDLYWIYHIEATHRSY